MNPLAALAVAALPAFIASIVEFVEAFTIVLAVGTTRGWRAPIWGTIAAAFTLAIIVGVFGAPLITYHDQVSSYFHLVVGVLLLLFGMRWLRKAILRFAGIIALHDEELIYQREVAELRAQGLKVGHWDNIGFWFSYKAVLLEGVEVAFIVIALGAQGGDQLRASVLGAIAAFILTSIAGVLLRRPLTFVPENWMKFVVGAMLTTFGIFWGVQGVWGAAGLPAEWPLGDATLLLLLAGVCIVSLAATRMLAAILPHRARVAARSV